MRRSVVGRLVTRNVRLSGSRGAWAFGVGVGRGFFEHRMTTYAAALAYRGLFGTFPFVLLVVALMAVLRFDGFFQWLIEQAGGGRQQFPQQLEPTVERGRDQAGFLVGLIVQAREQAGGGLLSVGVAIALWSTAALARTLVEALNGAYGVSETRPGWKRFALSVTFGPALALAAIFATGLMLVGPRLAGRLAGLVGLEEVFVVFWAWLRLPVALLLLAAVLSVVYRLGPNVYQQYRFVTPGAALAVASWALASLAFSLYLARFADYSLTYGALGTAIALLFYLYLSACSVLLGAEVNAAIYRHRLSREGKGTG